MEAKYVAAAVLMIVTSCRGKEDQSDAFGNFETEETIISSEIPGKLVSLPLDLGDRAEKGDLLAVVDTTQLSLQAKQLVSQQQAVASRRVQVRAQAEVLKEQIANLKITQARVGRMLADGAATQQQADDVDGQVRVLEKQLKSTTSQFVSIDSELAVTAAQLDLVNDNLARCYVRCPAAGTVLEKYAEQGELVSQGKAIVKLGDLSELDLRVYVSGARLPSIKQGQQVSVLIDKDTETNQSLTGEISWISSEAEFTPKIIQTKEERVKLVYAVKVKVKNDGRLKIGMPGEVRF